MTVPGADPERRHLQQDLEAADFEAGAGAGYWRLVSLDWPRLTVAVACGDGNELGLRVTVDGYPALAPAGEPWDLLEDKSLPAARWPQGGASPPVFRPDWSPSHANAPYLVCDRTAIRTHAPDWPDGQPDRAWHPGRTIAFYLSEVHRGLRGTVLPPPGVAQ